MKDGISIFFLLNCHRMTIKTALMATQLPLTVLNGDEWPLFAISYNLLPSMAIKWALTCYDLQSIACNGFN